MHSCGDHSLQSVLPCEFIPQSLIMAETRQCLQFHPVVSSTPIATTHFVMDRSYPFQALQLELKPGKSHELLEYSLCCTLSYEQFISLPTLLTTFNMKTLIDPLAFSKRL